MAARTFTNFGKSWATHKLIVSSTALSIWSPWSNSPFVVQGLQIGGTSPETAGNPGFRVGFAYPRPCVFALDPVSLASVADLTFAPTPPRVRKANVKS